MGFDSSLEHFGLPSSGVEYAVYPGWELWGAFDVADVSGDGIKRMIDVIVSPTTQLTFTVGMGYYEFRDRYCSGFGGSSFRIGTEDFGAPAEQPYAERGLVLCWEEDLYQPVVYQYYLTRVDSAFALAASTTRARIVGWWYVRVEDVETQPHPPTPTSALTPTPTPTPTPDPGRPSWRVRFDAPTGASCRLGNMPMPCSPDWVAVSPGVVALSFRGAGSGAIWVENGALVEKSVSVRASLGGDAPSVCIPAGCYPASSFGPWSVQAPAGSQIRAVYISQAGATGSELANAFVDLTGGGGGGGDGGGPSPTPTPMSWPGCDDLPPGCRCVFEPPRIIPVPSVSCLWFPPPVDLSAIGLGRTPALRVCFQKYSISLPQLDFMLDRAGLPVRSTDFLNMLTVAAGFYIAIRLVRRG
jgi:hypothetical protein